MTAQQRRVARLAALGLPPAEIAARLMVPFQTAAALVREVEKLSARAAADETMQGGAEAAREVHTLEVGGSSPPPAPRSRPRPGRRRATGAQQGGTLTVPSSSHSAGPAPAGAAPGHFWDAGQSDEIPLPSWMALVLAELEGEPLAGGVVLVGPERLTPRAALAQANDRRRRRGLALIEAPPALAEGSGCGWSSLGGGLLWPSTG